MFVLKLVVMVIFNRIGYFLFLICFFFEFIKMELSLKIKVLMFKIFWNFKVCESFLKIILFSLCKEFIFNFFVFDI